MLTEMDIPMPALHAEFVSSKQRPEISASSIDSAVDVYTSSLDTSTCASAQDLEQCFGNAGIEESVSVSEIAAWVTSAFAHWQHEYPTSSNISVLLAKARPAAFRAALCSDDFAAPGTHPLHKILDAAQQVGVGWESASSPASRNFEEALTAFVDGLYSPGGADIDKLYQQTSPKILADQDRISASLERLARSVTGKSNSTTSRDAAAVALNELIDAYPMPDNIGEFITGPWFDSAQLLLIRHSEESPEWAEFITVTQRLLESLQPAGDGSTSRRKEVLAEAAKLPKIISRCLVSLAHDPSAVKASLDKIKRAHMAAVKPGGVAARKIELLPLLNDTAKTTQQREELGITEGKWYELSLEGRTFRAIAVCANDADKEYVFGSFDGEKVANIPYETLLEMKDAGHVRHRSNRTTFSISLAVAAGIDSEEKYLRVTGEAAERQKQKEQEARKHAEAQAKIEREKIEREAADRARKEEEAARVRRQQAEEAAAREEEAQRAAEIEIELQLEADAAREVEEQKRMAEQQREEERQRRKVEEERERKEVERSELEARRSLEEAENGREHLRRRALREAELRGASRFSDIFEFGADSELNASEEVTNDLAAGANSSLDSATYAALQNLLESPAGTWFGFHDLEQPLLARLVVYSREEEKFMFTDRKGNLLRVCTKMELVSLFENDEVQVLQIKGMDNAKYA
ncbi:hypothetical protein A3709_20070 [Halioglobus sp. HI00S01]|uniref:DUF1631 family protein n=1 Tax=Halioglobus sp. HI00S01 TaxID=1822214 RepID=UPI0007C2EAB2|nr:DUF1631 family protein [Halioglobus sp. HI00S01]KZX57923.1 hypothetical protein A3709_20070 [Halioglobus sp. HI00S01]